MSDYWSAAHPCRYCGADSNVSHVDTCPNYGIVDAAGIPTPAQPHDGSYADRLAPYDPNRPGDWSRASRATRSGFVAEVRESVLAMIRDRVLEELALEDLPADHPIRQEVARLTVALALAEGRVARAVEALDQDAPVWTDSLEAQLLDILTR